MGKQKVLLHVILKNFEVYQNTNNMMKRDFSETKIRVLYLKSLNKKDLVRRLLFDALLSDDDLLKLLRIIFIREK